jgi:hypothetical protein
MHSGSSQVGQSGVDSSGRGWRGLTKGEAQIAKDSHGNAFNPDPVTLVHGRYLPTNRPHTIRDRIFFPKGYPQDFAREPAAVRGVLVHEFTHVWQYQTRFAGIFGVAGMAKARAQKPSYRYLPLTGGGFASYGIEQQAQIAEDAYRLSQGAQVTETTLRSGHPIPTLSQYRALIPFEGGL